MRKTPPMFRKVTHYGKFFFAYTTIFIVFVICGALVAYIKICAQHNDISSYEPTLIRSCPPIEGSVIYGATQITVHKNIWFCQSIGELNIPKKIGLKISSDRIIYPDVEDDSVATFTLPQGKNMYVWHIIKVP